MSTKRCGACQQIKTIDEFHLNKGGSHGRANRCKPCACAASREHGANNRESRRTYMAEWHDVHRGRRYGCGPLTYRALVEESGGRCAICQRTPNDRLVVDHDHLTGAIRQLLCRSCNAAIGALDDDPDLLERAARYLREHRSTPRTVLDEPARAVVRVRIPRTECTKGHLVKDRNVAPRGANYVQCRACMDSRKTMWAAKRRGAPGVDFLAYADKQYRELTGLEPNLAAPGRVRWAVA